MAQPPRTFAPLALFPAALVALVRDDQVLLQMRQNTGYMDGSWALGVAGKVEYGESVFDTAVREASEEAGVVIEPEDLELLTVMHCTDGTSLPTEQRVNWFFACRRWHGDVRIGEPQKCRAMRWFAMDALPARMPPHEREVLVRWHGHRLEAVTVHGFSKVADRCAHGD